MKKSRIYKHIALKGLQHYMHSWYCCLLLLLLPLVKKKSRTISKAVHWVAFTLSDFDHKNFKWHQINDVFALHHLDIYSSRRRRRSNRSTHTAPTMGYAMQHLFMRLDCNGIIVILLRRTTTKPEWDKEKKKKNTNPHQICVAKRNGSMTTTVYRIVNIGKELFIMVCFNCNSHQMKFSCFSA